MNKVKALFTQTPFGIVLAMCCLALLIARFINWELEERVTSYIKHDVEFTRGNEDFDVAINSYGVVNVGSRNKNETKTVTSLIKDANQLDSIKVAHEKIINKDIELFLSVLPGTGKFEEGTATKVN